MSRNMILPDCWRGPYRSLSQAGQRLAAQLAALPEGIHFNGEHVITLDDADVRGYQELQNHGLLRLTPYYSGTEQPNQHSYLLKLLRGTAPDNARSPNQPLHRRLQEFLDELAALDTETRSALIVRTGESNRPAVNARLSAISAARAAAELHKNNVDAVGIHHSILAIRNEYPIPARDTLAVMTPIEPPAATVEGAVTEPVAPATQPQEPPAHATA